VSLFIVCHPLQQGYDLAALHEIGGYWVQAPLNRFQKSSRVAVFCNIDGLQEHRSRFAFSRSLVDHRCTYVNNLT
jgi:hypothetical protein